MAEAAIENKGTYRYALDPSVAARIDMDVDNDDNEEEENSSDGGDKYYDGNGNINEDM